MMEASHHWSSKYTLRRREEEGRRREGRWLRKVGTCDKKHG